MFAITVVGVTTVLRTNYNNAYASLQPSLLVDRPIASLIDQVRSWPYIIKNPLVLLDDDHCSLRQTHLKINHTHTYIYNMKCKMRSISDIYAYNVVVF